MPQCKGCGDVVGVTQIINGACPKCSPITPRTNISKDEPIRKPRRNIGDILERVYATVGLIGIFMFLLLGVWDIFF